MSHLHPESTRSPYIGSVQSQLFTPPPTQPWSRQPTLDNATAEDLLRFNNSAFKLLLEDHEKLKTTCLALEANLQASRDLLDKMIQALPQVYSLVSGTVNDSSISPLASIINVGTAPSHPAFTELDPATYDNATVKAYWTRNGYNKRDEFAVEDEEEGEKNKTMRFVVHADGRVINKARVDTIRWECRKVWEQLMQDRISPIKWGNASVRAHDLLVRRLRSKYPELRLCQDNWKIEHIATNDYPKWYETHGKKRELVKLEEGAVEATRPSKRRLSAPTLATKRQQLETRRESENEKENPQLEPPAQPVDDLEDMYGDFPSHPSGVDGHEDRNNTDTDMPSKSSGAGFDDDHEDADQDIRKAPGTAHVGACAPADIGFMQVSDPAKAALSHPHAGPSKGKEREGVFPVLHSKTVEPSTAIVIMDPFRKITSSTDAPTPILVVSRVSALNSPPSLSIAALESQVTDAADVAERPKPARTKRTGEQKPKMCAPPAVPQINRLLFMKEYVEEHGPTTLAEFTKIWLAVDESTKQLYRLKVAQLKQQRKRDMLTTVPSEHDDGIAGTRGGGPSSSRE